MTKFKEGYYKLTPTDSLAIEMGVPSIIAYGMYNILGDFILLFNKINGGGFTAAKFVEKHSKLTLLEFTEVIPEGKNRCGFCGKQEGEVALILKVNEKAVICNDCVSIAVAECNKYLNSMHLENSNLKKEGKRIISLN